MENILCFKKKKKNFFFFLGVICKRDKVSGWRGLMCGLRAGAALFVDLFSNHCVPPQLTQVLLKVSYGCVYTKVFGYTDGDMKIRT